MRPVAHLRTKCKQKHIAPAGTIYTNLKFGLRLHLHILHRVCVHVCFCYSFLSLPWNVLPCVCVFTICFCLFLFSFLFCPCNAPRALCLCLLCFYCLFLLQLSVFLSFLFVFVTAFCHHHVTFFTVFVFVTLYLFLQQLSVCFLLHLASLPCIVPHCVCFVATFSLLFSSQFASLPCLCLLHFICYTVFVFVTVFCHYRVTFCTALPPPTNTMVIWGWKWPLAYRANIFVISFQHQRTTCKYLRLYLFIVQWNKSTDPWGRSNFGFQHL